MAPGPRQCQEPGSPSVTICCFPSMRARSPVRGKAARTCAVAVTCDVSIRGGNFASVCRSANPVCSRVCVEVLSMYFNVIFQYSLQKAVTIFFTDKNFLWRTSSINSTEVKRIKSKKWFVDHEDPVAGVRTPKSRGRAGEDCPYRRKLKYTDRCRSGPQQ